MHDPRTLAAFPRSPSKALRGLFFRPKTRHWVAGHGDMEWAQFWTTTQYNTNAYASSPTAYFGLNPLAFAARYAPCPWPPCDHYDPCQV